MRSLYLPVPERFRPRVKVRKLMATKPEIQIPTEEQVKAYLVRHVQENMKGTDMAERRDEIIRLCDRVEKVRKTFDSKVKETGETPRIREYNGTGGKGRPPMTDEERIAKALADF